MSQTEHYTTNALVIFFPKNLPYVYYRTEAMKGSITLARPTKGNFVFRLFLLMFWEYFVYERSAYLVIVQARV